uniref:Immediate early protein ICP-46/RNA ligase n=1 Tax=Rhinella marina erythrocytic-like virus TaxID=2859906 RepID=A0A8F6UAB4_9VIRU|nr:immediate early protein ICP-46/RNA ligase [Rhinella marina erythrocytic-like virus]
MEMNNSINSDEYTFISHDLMAETTTFFDIESGNQLFVNLPSSIVVTDLNHLKTLLPNLDGANVSIAEEGTTIRVFYNREKWYTSTKRKLQAFKSRWADKTCTFGATFAQAVRNELGELDDERPDQEFLEAFYEQYLDKDKIYFFVLRNTEGERIVCDPPENAKALHICTQKNGVNDFKHRICINIGPFTHTTTIKNNYTDIKCVLDEIDYHTHQGVIVEQNGVFYKLLVPEYAKLAAIRGSTASLKMCYLKLRNPEFFKERHLFLKLYPSFASQVEQLETDIYLVCCRLHKIYMDKFIGKRQLNLNITDASAIKIIHKRHIVDKLPTTPNKINDILVDYPVTINHLLKEKTRFENHCAQQESNCLETFKPPSSQNTINMFSRQHHQHAMLHD